MKNVTKFGITGNVKVSSKMVESLKTKINKIIKSKKYGNSIVHDEVIKKLKLLDDKWYENLKKTIDEIIFSEIEKNLNGVVDEVLTSIDNLFIDRIKIECKR